MGARRFGRLMPTAVALVTSLVASISCDKGSRSLARPTVPSPPFDSPQPPAPPQPSGEVVRLGEPISGTITSDSDCKFANGDPRFADLCHAFTVTAPQDGTLVAEVRVTADAALALRFRTATGDVIDTFCCTRMTGRVPVRAGVVVQIELAYIGRPPGYPSIQPVGYTLELSLLTGALQQRGNLRAIVFGDATHTQRLPNARLEVLDGPAAGQLARLDDATGLYELLDLAPGFVRIRTMAPEFNPVEQELVVGTQWPREITLQRTVPLVKAEHTLSGMVRAGASNSFLGGVKIEILDGPLAGVFTFTDDDMAMYVLHSLTPGVMRVRASHGGLTQTLDVDLAAGSNTLNFSLGSR
jgi:hypothetical protein